MLTVNDGQSYSGNNEIQAVTCCLILVVIAVISPGNGQPFTSRA